MSLKSHAIFCVVDTLQVNVDAGTLVICALSLIGRYLMKKSANGRHSHSHTLKKLGICQNTGCMSNTRYTLDA